MIWIFLDKDFKFVPEASGVKQVLTPNQLGEFAVLNLTMPKNGYIYIYVSDESNKDVSFDNLRISQTTSSFVEENHYYPFGMLIEDLSTSIANGQKYKYNGKELQTDLDFKVEDYGARHYDATIGRWMQVDPLAEKYRRWSPYNYCVGNPVRFIDPDGMAPGDIIGKQAEVNLQKNKVVDAQSTLYMPKANIPIISQVASDKNSQGVIKQGTSNNENNLRATVAPGTELLITGSVVQGAATGILVGGAVIAAEVVLPSMEALKYGAHLLKTTNTGAVVEGLAAGSLPNYPDNAPKLITAPKAELLNDIVNFLATLRRESNDNNKTKDDKKEVKRN